jgi:chromate transporter
MHGGSYNGNIAKIRRNHMSSNTGDPYAKQAVSLWELFAAYFLIGLTGFGPSIVAETKKNIVKRKKWVSEEELMNGLALGQLLPGATFCSLTVYIGYKIRGVAGAITSFVGFLLPPFFVMTLLSFLYFQYGEISVVKTLLTGVVAIVVGLVANAVVEVGKSAIKDIKGAFIALISLALMIIYPNIFVILAVAALAGLLFFYPSINKQQGPISTGEHLPPISIFKSSQLKAASILVVAILLLIYIASLQPILLNLGMVFFKMGALVFGNGFTMIPLIQQEVVTHYHWLSMDEFAVGLALGQMTPGPVLITSTFVGYKVAAIKGALVSTLAMFLPSLLLVMLTAEIHNKVRNNPWVKAAFEGILASFVGMMLVVLAGLVRHSLVDATTALLAVLSFIILRFTKIDVIWVVTGGALLYWILHLI